VLNVAPLRDKRSLMYRCHFTQRNHIVAGENLRATTLVEAIEEAEKIFAARRQTDGVDGFEIWTGTNLLYSSLRQSGGDSC
jgi:hypothetical protein